MVCLRFLTKTKSSNAGRVRRDSDAPDLSRVHPNPDEWLAAVLARTPQGPGEGGGQPNGSTGPKRRRGRRILVALCVAVAVGAVGVLGWFAATAATERAQARRDLQAAQSRLEGAAGTISALTADRDALRAQLSEGEGQASGLRAELAEARADLERLRESRTRPRYVPNGKAVTVEIGGYEGSVEIHDVHLRHAYGFSDLVGIAVNTSGRDLAYVQLGCTLLDGEGRVLANVIDNRETWPAGATWGFTCSAEVAATGGIVRVDALE